MTTQVKSLTSPYFKTQRGSRELYWRSGKGAISPNSEIAGLDVWIYDLDEGGIRYDSVHLEDEVEQITETEGDLLVENLQLKKDLKNTKYRYRGTTQTLLAVSSIGLILSLLSGVIGGPLTVVCFGVIATIALIFCVAVMISD